MTFVIVDGLSSNYCGNERCKTAYIHTYTVVRKNVKHDTYECYFFIKLYYIEKSGRKK